MIDYNIEFLVNKISHFHFHGHGNIRLPSKKLIFDPSILYYLMSCDLRKNDFEIYLPDTLLKLIELSKENSGHKKFLNKFLTYFSYSRTSSFDEDSWSRFYCNLEKLEIKPITLENVDNKEKYDNIASMFIKHKFYISMSPEINFLGDILAKIIGFSMKSGIAILSKTRRLSNLLREKLIALELPKKFDEAVMIKKEIVGKLFDFQGGRATKFFIGIALSFGGLIHPAIVIPGLMFAFMDP